MKNEQDALKCADDLEKCYDLVDFDGDLKRAAEHIRRLVSENQAFYQALQWIDENGWASSGNMLHEAREAIRKVKSMQ